ncbi:hypothetical protein EVAR_61712_1 [Eumeta japonica]|uniref:Uncharacterized protein n=1 Tax=Eumeta variegata TaxID=151549 RepID=A0A4C1ZMP9_EUMVA|nr:hypothetical protein EVAR_61712_1 [Eumeta japonica]
MRIIDVIEAINCRCKSVRRLKQYVPWPTDIVGGGRRLIVNRRSKDWDWEGLGCDPAMLKNHFDASFIYLEREWGVLNLYGELNYERTNVRPWLLYRIYSVLPVTYAVL